MKITKEWLIEKDVCEEGLNWFLNQEETDLYKLIEKLNRFIAPEANWAVWLITRAMTRKQAIEYAIISSEFVLPLFERWYLEDQRPRLAIEAAKKVLENDTEENRNLAYEAARATRGSLHNARCDYSWCMTVEHAVCAASSTAMAAYNTIDFASWAYDSAWVARDTWHPVIGVGVEILEK